MAAAAPAPVPAPLREEGMRFWEQLIDECRRQTNCINQTLYEHGRSPADYVECRAGAHLQIIRERFPSTTAKVDIAFERWGPVIGVLINGYQKPGFEFHQEEFEIPLARDVDGSVVAVFDEGRSLCPREVASLLVQHFRRCFPRISLPCPDQVRG
jgi:hypothetical protein